MISSFPIWYSYQKLIICTQPYGYKNSYPVSTICTDVCFHFHLIQIICTFISYTFKLIYMTHWWNHNTLSLSRSGINASERVILHSQKFQHWNLITKYSLMLYAGHLTVLGCFCSFRHLLSDFRDVSIYQHFIFNLQSFY